MKKSTLILLFFAMVGSTVAAQTELQTNSLSEGTIDQQFEYAIRRSNNWQEFEVIKKTWMYQLRKSVLDSLAQNKNEVIALEAKVDGQASQISKLETDLTTANTQITQLSKEKASISFFGALINKGLYQTIMWSIVGGLLALLVFFILKFKSSNVLTRDAKLRLDEIEKEYEDHRRTALEREQKVRRQLQDEINKNRALSKSS